MTKQMEAETNAVISYVSAWRRGKKRLAILPADMRKNVKFL